MTDLSMSRVELSELVYDGFACNAKSKNELKRCDEFAEEVFTFADIVRYQMAVSGAMRWPWSQEVIIKIEAKVSYG